MGFLSYGYKALKSGVGQAINKTKTNVPKTKIQKATRDLKISTQKLKGSKAKLDQSVFEMKTISLLLLKKVQKNQNQIKKHTKEYKTKTVK